MKYVNDVIYKPNTVVYWYQRGRIGVGKVVDAVIRIGENYETIEYKVLDIADPLERIYLFIKEEHIAYDLSTLSGLLTKAFEKAEMDFDLKEDIFNVDKD